ncbi:MAG: ATP-binding protein [bacterium]
MNHEFIGREAEIESLMAFLNKEAPSIGVVYGRRRIGKSVLIRKALEGRRVLMFEGLENQPKGEQIKAFLFELGRQADLPTGSKSIKTWREALAALEPVLRKKPACIVLDEFQWMANYRHDLVSDLKMVWEQYLANIPGVKLVLCGSIASFMLSKVVRSSALYGRTDLQLRLDAFNLGEACALLRDKGLDEVIEAYLCFGGVPKYLDLIRDFPSIRDAVEQLAFKDNGYFVEEYDRVFTSHFGRNPDYRRIVMALSSHPQGLFRKDLAAHAGVDLGGTLSTHLEDLESAGFVMSVIPVDKGGTSRLIRYMLNDPYMRFYFSFIRPSLKRIQSKGQEGLFAGISQSGRYQAWRGRAFEYLCMGHARQLARLLGFSGVEFSAGPYFRAPAKDRPGFQVDLLFARADKVLTLCEMKCSVAPLGMDVIREVERKAGQLQQEFPSKTIQRVLVIHGEPSREVVRSGYFYRIIRAAELAGES